MAAATDYFRAYIEARGFPGVPDGVETGLSLPEKIAASAVMAGTGLAVAVVITLAIVSLAWTQLGINLLSDGLPWAVRAAAGGSIGLVSVVFVGAPLADWLFSVPIEGIDEVTIDG